ncbi:hypothetical protein L210DRAFT_3565468, partial [Boletus edulis BED1]
MVKVFDLVCGTSTGGIIAILLGRLGLDCSTAISVYKELGPRVFGMDEGKMWSQIAAGEGFSDGPNTPMKILKSERHVKHRTTDVGTGSASAVPYRGTTCVLPDNIPWTIREAVRATSATPMYFTPLEIGLQAVSRCGCIRIQQSYIGSISRSGTPLAPLGTGLTSPPSQHLNNFGCQLIAVANDTENTPLGSCQAFAEV